MTTQFQPPPPPEAQVPGAPLPTESYGPRPLSAAAVAGFVCSLVGVCIPFLGPLVGLIFGIVGLARTSGGRRRGRGLAIAALPIALIVGAGHTWATVAFVRWGQSVRAIDNGLRATLRASGPKVPEAAADLYQSSSKRFRMQVSEEQFQNWMAAMVKKHGQLQAIRLAPKPFEMIGPDQFAFRQEGRFVNRRALIEVICGAEEGSKAKFDDIRIDGESPLPD